MSLRYPLCERFDYENKYTLLIVPLYKNVLPASLRPDIVINLECTYYDGALDFPYPSIYYNTLPTTIYYSPTSKNEIRQR